MGQLCGRCMQLLRDFVALVQKMSSELVHSIKECLALISECSCLKQNGSKTRQLYKPVLQPHERVTAQEFLQQIERGKSMRFLKGSWKGKENLLGGWKQTAVWTALTWQSGVGKDRTTERFLCVWDTKSLSGKLCGNRVGFRWNCSVPFFCAATVKYDPCTYVSWKQVLLVTESNFFSQSMNQQSWKEGCVNTRCYRSLLAGNSSMVLAELFMYSYDLVQSTWSCTEGACAVCGEGWGHPETNATGLRGLPQTPINWSASMHFCVCI